MTVCSQPTTSRNLRTVRISAQHSPHLPSVCRRYDLFWDLPGHFTASERQLNDTWQAVLEEYRGCD